MTCNCNVEHDVFDPCYDYCASSVKMCQIGNDSLLEGATYCDGNNNLFKCVGGQLVFQSSNCGGTTTPPASQCQPGYYFDITQADCVPIEGFTTPPLCDFQISPTSAKVGDVITFIPLECTADASSWVLDFGDGTSYIYGSGAPVANKTHIYTKAGTYYPKLTATNSGGSLSATGTISIAGESMISPHCDFQVFPTSANVGDAVTFRPLACTGDTVIDWFFDFGDGSSYLYGSGSPIADHYHTYSKPGTFYPSLTVGTSWGGSTSATGTISISASPIVVPPVLPPVVPPVLPPVVPPVVTCTGKPCGSACPCVTGQTCGTDGKCAAGGSSVLSCQSGYTYNSTTKKCVANSSGGSAAAVECVGLNRGGSLDPTCILEKGNESYLVIAIGLVALVILLRK